ncbi:hypothetical protein Vretimale_15376 [Volvox reticuliferus]|uniref:RING-type domain-containing protein n=1 Tax=Volvox reticuliferus TaxID=1737510 RepID=A0A8J4GNY2_9CHLO|nr:hypothetical protein Vretifemale_16437 [Volvox reticuliferus]GIM11936.1 hypothetical protein Vretimale_15376 [Volvox reticuliferus]
MGCATSCIAPSVAELNNSVKSGDEDNMLKQLSASPRLLSTPTSVLSSTGVTPIHQACESKQVKVVEQIISFMSCSSLETVRDALLPYCRRVGRQRPTSIAEGIRIVVDMTNAKGQTPLMYACFSDCPDLVKLLLSKGADPWVGDRCGGRTALHYAAMGGSAACIQAIMKHISPRLMTRQGVRYVDARSLCGLTPLHYCVYFGKMEAIKELLNNYDPHLNTATLSESYDVSVTCEARSTALHFAAVTGNEEAARELLRYYYQRFLRNPAVADPRTRVNAAGQLPWQVALAYHPAAVDLASLLHPGQPLERVLLGPASAQGVAGGGMGLGPATLSTIAAAAVRAKLLADLQKANTHRPDVVVEEEEETTVAAQGAMTVDAAAAVATTAASLTGSECHGSCASNETSVSERRGRRCGSLRGRRRATIAPLPVRCTPSPCTSASPSTTAAMTRSPHRATATTATTAATVGDAVSGGGSRTERVAGGNAAANAVTTAMCDAALNRLEEPSAPKSPQSQREKEENKKLEGEEEDGSQCEVCFAARVAVSPAGCRHGLCVGCAEQLCSGVTRRPLHCPFCRGVVSGFVRISEQQGPMCK